MGKMLEVVVVVVMGEDVGEGCSGGSRREGERWGVVTEEPSERIVETPSHHLLRRRKKKVPTS